MRLRTAFFESWRGRYADSPRAISEALGRRRPDVTRYWVVGDGETAPDDVVPVRRHGPEYFRHLLTSDLVVANDIISKHVVKGPRATYLQTWHGTPLKTVGYDEALQAYAGARAHRRRMRRDVAKWDLLLSPSTEVTRVLRGAFGYRGRVLESGYPRNDVLRSTDAPQVRRRMRAALGIDDDRLVVLYAPTWRDDLRGADGRFTDPGLVDAGLLARALPGATLLLRMHRVMGAAQASVPGFTVDVSTYPEIADLYLAADVLVSDYSSAVYDFAVTGKPVVLHAPDLERYATDVRGLYYDYREWAPGRVTTTTEELGEVLAAVDEVHRAHEDRYEAFVERFCPLEDGHATDRVLEALLGG